jgi:Spy/CpxP family protein refolding chaperone
MGGEVMPMLTRNALLMSFALGSAATATGLGCGGSVVSAQGATAGGTRAPVAQSAHGQIKLLGEALGDVALTDAQRGSIEKLAVDADARHEQGRAARRDLLLAVASQVEAGAIDRGALGPKIDAVKAAIEAAQPADRAAFEQLHAVLGPDQRVAFVDALEARIFHRAGEGLGMREWAETVKLTDAQRDQIKGILAQAWGEWKDHGDHDHDARGGHDGGPWAGGMRRGAKLLEAFKQDHFVFDEVAPRRAAAAAGAGPGMAAMGDRLVTLAAQVLPVLTAEQRSLAAQKLRERANAPDIDRLP